MPRSTTRPQNRVGSTLRLLAPLILGAVVLLGWQLSVTVGVVPPTILPSPMAVLQRFITEITGGQLVMRTAVTVGEAALGCLVALLVALPLGYLIARNGVVEAATNPFLAASQAIPAVALAPLLVLWVGYGLAPVVLLCALLVFFPLVLTAVLGLRTLDRDVLEAAQLDGADGWQLLRHIEWPLSLPAVLTGIRNGFTLSITGAVVGELVMGGTGLGMVLSVQGSSGDTVGLFATLLTLGLLAVLIFMALLSIERVADPQGPDRNPVFSYLSPPRGPRRTGVQHP